MTDDWTSSLTQAFGVLLGRPLSEYDANATYAVYYGGNWLSESESDQDPAWLDQATLAGRETIAFDELLHNDDESYPDLRFDPAGSIFEIDPAELSDAFVRDLDAVALPDQDSILVRGADLAPLLDRHAAEVAPLEGAHAWYVWQARIASDGSLLDALRVATGIGDGPDSLIPYGPRMKYATVEVNLEDIADPGLRAHLRGFCLTGGHSLDLLDLSDFESPIDGCPVVIGWQGAVDQYEIVVLQLSDDVMGKSLA